MSKDAVRKANDIPGRSFALSLSAGVALFDPERPRTLDELIGEADRHMYEAKHAQRTSERHDTDRHQVGAGGAVTARSSDAAEAHE